MDNNLRETAENQGARYAELLINGTDASIVKNDIVEKASCLGDEYYSTLLRSVDTNLRRNEDNTLIEMRFNNAFDPKDGFEFYKHDTKKMHWNLNPINNAQAIFSDIQRAFEMNDEHKIFGASASKDDIRKARGENVGDGQGHSNMALTSQTKDSLYDLEHPAQEQQSGPILTHVSDTLQQQRMEANQRHLYKGPPDIYGTVTYYREAQAFELDGAKAVTLENGTKVFLVVDHQQDRYGRPIRHR